MLHGNQVCGCRPGYGHPAAEKTFRKLVSSSHKSRSSPRIFVGIIGAMDPLQNISASGVPVARIPPDSHNVPRTRLKKVQVQVQVQKRRVMARRTPEKKKKKGYQTSWWLERAQAPSDGMQQRFL